MRRDDTGRVDDSAPHGLGRRRLAAPRLTQSALLLATWGALSVAACTRTERWPLEIPGELVDANTKTLVAAAFRGDTLEALEVLEPSAAFSSDAALPQLIDADDTTLSLTLVGYGDPARLLNLPTGDLLTSPLERTRTLPMTNLVFTTALGPGEEPSSRPWRAGDTAALSRVRVPSLPPICPDFSTNVATDLDPRVVEPLDDGQLLVGVREAVSNMISFGRFEADGAALRNAELARTRLRPFTDQGGDITDILRIGSRIYATTSNRIVQLDLDGAPLWSAIVFGDPNHLVASADGVRWYAASRSTLFSWSSTTNVVREAPGPTTTRPNSIVSLAMREDVLYALVSECGNATCSGVPAVGWVYRRDGETWTVVAELPEEGGDMALDDNVLVVAGDSLLMKLRSDQASVETGRLPEVFVGRDVQSIIVVAPGRYAVLGNAASLALTSADLSRTWCTPRTGSTRYFDDLAVDPTTGDLLMVDDRSFAGPVTGPVIGPGLLVRFPTR